MTLQLTITDPSTKNINRKTGAKEGASNQPRSSWRDLVKAFWRQTDVMGQTDTTNFKGLL